MVSCDKVVGTLPSDVLHSLTPEIHTIDDINKISKRIDWLTNQAFHIRKLTKQIFNIRKGVKSIPYFGIIKICIEHSYQNTKSNGSYKRN
jgi:hypothetical protein